MTVDCPPNDYFCQQAHTIQVEDEIDRKSFSLGIFNGREYIYSESDGKTTIIIHDATRRDLRDAAETPPDFLETDGTVSTVETENGEG